MLKKSSLLVVLKNKDFLRIWSAQVFSLITANMLNFVLIDRIFKATASTVTIGLFFALYYLPTAVFAPFVGVFVDRWNKKKILIFSSLLQAVIVLFYLGLNSKIWPIYAIVLLYSLCDEFFNPTIGACLPSVVKRDSLPAANGFFLLTTQGALAIGFLAGGLVLRFLSGNLVFWVASFILLIASISASGLSQKVLEKRKEAEFSLAGFQKELTQGYQFIRNEPLVFFPIILLVLLQVFLGMIIILLPSISHHLLSISLADASFILIIPAIAGVIIGSFLTGKLIKSLRKKRLITFGLHLTGILILIFDFFLPQIKFPLFLAVVLSVALGIAFALMMVPSQTLVQENTPFGVRGRVFSTLSSLVTLAAAVPMLITASLVDLFGISRVLLCFSLIIIALGFYAQRGKYGLLGTNHWA